MKPQLSQTYNVDARYSGGKGSADNDAGKAFVASYIKRQRVEKEPEVTAERQADDRFVVSGPGDSTYSFKNAFRASK
jgi:hypothetical protein